MSKYILIEADTNDGDYITSLNKISDEKLELIRPVVKSIKNFIPGKSWNERHNYLDHNYHNSISGYSPKELYGHLEGFEDFNELRPYGEDGIHTIVSVKIVDIIEELL